jgi:hypothetical protein
VARDTYVLIARAGPRVDRRRFAGLEEAFAQLEARVEELSRTARRGAVDVRYRRFEPVQQVAARVQIAGPRRLHGGIDVRGDGSTEAYTGRWRRRLVEQRPGESACDALRRALAERAQAATTR